MACPAPKLMMRSYNPASKSNMIVQQERGVQTLFNCSLKRVRALLGINRLAFVNHLNIPSEIKNKIRAVTLNEFYINPDKITALHHGEKRFPATCLFDNTPVDICLHDSEALARTQPFLVTTFTSNGKILAVYEIRETLDNVISKSKALGSVIDEQTIWMYMSQICQVIKCSPASIRLEPRSLCFRNKVLIFNDHAVRRYSTSKWPVYDAPEVLMKQTANKGSLVWSLGCILYEMVTLKPPFHNSDPSGITDVLVSMIEGEYEELPEDGGYSEELLDLITDCLSKDEDDRPSVEEISQISLDKMFIL